MRLIDVGQISMPLDRINKFRETSEGVFICYDSDGEIGAALYDPRDIIMQIIPVVGEWRTLYASTDGMYAEPVIAWGVTYGSDVVPISPEGSSGYVPGVARRSRKTGGFILEDVATGIIYGGGRSFDSREKWYASLEECDKDN